MLFVSAINTYSKVVNLAKLFKLFQLFYLNPLNFVSRFGKTISVSMFAAAMLYSTYAWVHLH